MKQCTCYALRAIDCTCKPAKYGELYTSPTAKQEQDEPESGFFSREAMKAHSDFHPQQRTWVGLIPEEIDEIIENSIDKVDALIQTMDKLKEKNT